MKGIRPIITPLKVEVINNQTVARNSKLYNSAKDTFVRSTATKDVAAKFRKQVVLPFSHWDSSFPADYEKGSGLLQDMLEPYIKAIKGFSAKDAEMFSKLVFGEKHIKQLEEGSKKNTDLKIFKETLEDVMGKTLSEVIVKK